MGTVGPDRTRMNDVADLFNENFADVWRFVRRRTMSSADADEVTAETFATACRRSADLPPGPERRLWLFGVARYVLANHRRTLARRHRLSARLQSLRQDSSVKQQSSLDDQLLVAMAKLSAEDRELLIMRAWDGLVVTDMAALLRSTPNAVSVRLTKARRKLSQLLMETAPDRSGHEADDPAVHEEGHANG